VKARLVFPATVLTARMPGAYDPYARCSRSVCSVLTACMPGTWETFAQRSEINNGPSPCIAGEQSSEAKRWSRWKGQKIYRRDILM